MNEIILAFAPPEPPAKPSPVTFFFISCAANLRRRPLRRVDKASTTCATHSGIRTSSRRNRPPRARHHECGQELVAKRQRRHAEVDLERRGHTVAPRMMECFRLGWNREFRSDLHMKAHLFEHDLLENGVPRFRIML